MAATARISSQPQIVNVAAIDRDPDAIARGQPMVKAFDGRFSLYEGTFSAIQQLVAGSEFEQVDGIVFDLGVCSTQLRSG